MGAHATLWYGGLRTTLTIWFSYSLVLSFNYVGLEDRTQVTRLSVRCLYPLSYLTGPGFCGLYSDSLGCMNLEKPLAKQGSRTTVASKLPFWETKRTGWRCSFHETPVLSGMWPGGLWSACPWSRNFVCAGRCLCVLWLARGSLYLSAHHSCCRRLLDCVLPTSEEDPGLSSPWFFKSAHHSNRHSFSWSLATDLLVLFTFSQNWLSFAYFPFVSPCHFFCSESLVLSLKWLINTILLGTKSPGEGSRTVFHLIITENKVIHCWPEA